MDLASARFVRNDAFKCIEDYANKSNLRRMPFLRYMVVNSTMIELRPEPSPTPTLWYHLVYEKIFKISIVFRVADGVLVKACL